MMEDRKIVISEDDMSNVRFDEDEPHERLEDVRVGDELTVLTKAGRDDRIIGRLSDGRVILFAKDSPYELEIGDTVVGEVIHVKDTYVLIKPNKILGDNTDALEINLKNVIASGHYQHAVLAKGILELLERCPSTSQ